MWFSKVRPTCSTAATDLSALQVTQTQIFRASTDSTGYMALKRAVTGTGTGKSFFGGFVDLISPIHTALSTISVRLLCPGSIFFNFASEAIRVFHSAKVD
jgi:hypothetical protein